MCSNKINFLACLSCTSSTLIFLNRRSKVADYLRASASYGGERMKGKTWESRTFSWAHKDFPVHISDSIAIADNTAGLVAVRHRSGKIMNDIFVLYPCYPWTRHLIPLHWAPDTPALGLLLPEWCCCAQSGWQGAPTYSCVQCEVLWSGRASRQWAQWDAACLPESTSVLSAHGIMAPLKWRLSCLAPAAWSKSNRNHHSCPFLQRPTTVVVVSVPKPCIK